MFYGITKIRDKEKLSNQQFEKMAATKPIFGKLGLSKIDLSFLFQQATGNAKFVEFLPFCNLMYRLWWTKVALGKKSAFEITFGEFIKQLQ